MGKKQHQKDKMYLTTTEWSEFYGGYKTASHSGVKASFRRLPLCHCCLSLQPFSYPYCDSLGNIFDLEALLPFLKKFKVNPVTGKSLSEKQLIKLHFHKGSSGEYHCPVLYKPLTNSSHVVALKTTGNVFSYEAVEQLNLKVSNWRDLLSDESFTKDDIIVLQDPANLEKFNISKFHHVKNNLKVLDEDFEKSKVDSNLRLKHVTLDTKEILDEYKKVYKDLPKSEETADHPVADEFNAAHYSTGKVAASFTSTTMEIETKHQPAILDDETVRYRRAKKKGYVSLKTNLGDINIELHCDTVQKTCENFLRLCASNYYNNTKFHRSIRHFMIQGGDPTGTGKGGNSFWGGTFKDEFRQNLSHKGRGVLSMANSGPDTNRSQFFITYRSCPHLDGKHTIFGRVVGGLNTLSAMEAIGTDNKDRPVTNIVLLATAIFVDPFAEADEQLAEERRKKEAANKEEIERLDRKRKLSVEATQVKVFRPGVGKFLDLKRAEVSKDDVSSQSQQKKKKEYYGFKDFSVF